MQNVNTNFEVFWDDLKVCVMDMLLTQEQITTSSGPLQKELLDMQNHYYNTSSILVIYTRIYVELFLHVYFYDKELFIGEIIFILV